MPDGLNATIGQGAAGLPQNFELAAGAGRAQPVRSRRWDCLKGQPDITTSDMETKPMADLTNYERTVLRMIEGAAEAGLPCPSNLDIEMELGCNSTSVAPVVVRRLEEKGFIIVTRYQRAREITVTSTGLTTARHPQRNTNRKHVPRGSGSTSGKLSKIARQMG
jgi:hypothetical protein